MVDPKDRHPQGDPETYISLDGGSIVGLYIKGVGAHTILGIREDSEGHPVSCAVANTVSINHPRMA